MKNQIVKKLMGTKFVGPILEGIIRVCVSNKSLILTTGTIGCSLATTALAVKNSAAIASAVNKAKTALSLCNTKEERDDVYRLFLKEMTRLALPILIFQAGTIACAIANKKHSDKLETRLAEMAGALSITQTALNQYQSFQKEAEQALGEEKIHDIQKEIAENTVYEVSRSPVNTKQSEDDQLIYEPITGQLFWSTPDRINLAWEKYRNEVQNSDEAFVPVSAVFFDRLGADSRTSAAEVFGYYNEDASYMSDTVYLDTTKVIVNGKEMSALKINYYPTIRLSTDERFD